MQKVFRTVEKSSFVNMSRKGAMLVCQVPSSPILVSTSSSKITFASFVTDICSTFGFWFGVPALSVIHSIDSIVNRIINRDQKSKKAEKRKTRVAKEKRELVLHIPLNF